MIVKYPLWAFGLLLVLSPSLHGQDRALKAKINNAIDRGVRYLRAQVKGNGVDYSGLSVYTAGMTALAGWTLLESGVAADDAVVERLAQTTRAAAVTSSDTYHLALAIIFLDRLGHPADEPFIEGMAVRLLAGQEATGSWSYKTRLAEATEQELREYMTAALENWDKYKKKSEKPSSAADLPVEVKRILHNARRLDGLIGGDNSNTQFAMMGLWVARRHGLPVDRALLGLSESFRKRQFPSGMWGYIHAPLRPEEPPAGDDQGPRVTMTCAGLLGIALGNGVKKKNKIAAPPLDKDANVKAGLKALGAWLADPESARGKALLHKPGNFHYFLFSLERMAVVYDVKKIGGTDWYVWGAEKLVDTQTPKGNWEGMYQAADTCFALLFLKRANVARDLTLDLRGIVRQHEPPPSSKKPRKNERERDPFDVPNIKEKKKKKAQSSFRAGTDRQDIAGATGQVKMIRYPHVSAVLLNSSTARGALLVHSSARSATIGAGFCSPICS